VVGVDLSADAIAYARTRYARPNVEFRVDDLLAPRLDDRSFDVVCSLETLEHLPDRDAFLREVVRVLRDDGVFVVSTPACDATTERPENPFHCVEYSRPDFAVLLGATSSPSSSTASGGCRRAAIARCSGSTCSACAAASAFLRPLGKLATGTEPTQEVSLDGLAIEREDVDTADVLVAVCTRPARR
jgi:SAM-dependent methyltransferase